MYCFLVSLKFKESLISNLAIKPSLQTNDFFLTVASADLYWGRPDDDPNGDGRGKRTQTTIWQTCSTQSRVVNLCLSMYLSVEADCPRRDESARGLQWKEGKVRSNTASIRPAHWRTTPKSTGQNYLLAVDMTMGHGGTCPSERTGSHLWTSVYGAAQTDGRTDGACLRLTSNPSVASAARSDNFLRVLWLLFVFAICRAGRNKRRARCFLHSSDCLCCCVTIVE